MGWGEQGQQGTQPGQFKRFEGLLAWREARELTRAVYSLSSRGPLRSDQGLKDQLRRAAVSVMSNLADGYERIGQGEKAQYMNIARASCAEVKSLLYVCLDNQYLEPETVNDLQGRCTQISRLTSGLIRAIAKRKSQPTPPTTL